MLTHRNLRGPLTCVCLQLDVHSAMSPAARSRLSVSSKERMQETHRLHRARARRGAAAGRRGDFGRLGHADCGDVFLPKALAALDGQRIVSCACGDTHTLCMAADGALWAFGRNSNGQLGNGSTEDSATPRLVEAMRVPCRLERSTLWAPDL